MSRGFESHRLRQRQHLTGGCLFIFATNFARAARWDSKSPCSALCVPPGCNSPADCCKGAGESHRLRQVSLPNSTLGSDFLLDSFSGATTSSSAGESKKDYIVKRPSGIMKVRSANCTNRIPGGLLKWKKISQVCSTQHGDASIM